MKTKTTTKTSEKHDTEKTKEWSEREKKREGCFVLRIESTVSSVYLQN